MAVAKPDHGMGVEFFPSFVMSDNNSNPDWDHVENCCRVGKRSHFFVCMMHPSSLVLALLHFPVDPRRGVIFVGRQSNKDHPKGKQDQIKDKEMERGFKI